VQPERLRSARQAAGLTQQQAAKRLGVSQAYLALLERGHRPVTPQLGTKIVKVYNLGPAALPLEIDFVESWDSASVATALASLGYSGFRHLRGHRKKNPAAVLLGALTAKDLEVRVVEGLPWLVAGYSDLDWEWAVREAKMRDVQNRLGFLVSLGRQVAEMRGDNLAAERLRRVEEALDRVRLVREDTLCQDFLSDAERNWLRQTRPPDARHWNLLTDLTSQGLPYAA
jgi:transcriptional regulator with XRE-family HTH domain